MIGGGPAVQATTNAGEKACHPCDKQPSRCDSLTKRRLTLSATSPGCGNVTRAGSGNTFKSRRARAVHSPYLVWRGAQLELGNGDALARYNWAMRRHGFPVRAPTLRYLRRDHGRVRQHLAKLLASQTPIRVNRTPLRLPSIRSRRRWHLGSIQRQCNHAGERSHLAARRI